MGGRIASDECLDLIFREARTYNGYVDRPVSAVQIEAIWELMKLGPTSANALPARMVWCLSQESRDRLADCATGANPPKIRAAPAAVIIGMDLEFHEHLPEFFPHADARSWFHGNEALIASTAIRNSSLQAAYFIVAARALGLDTGPMSGFDADKVNDAFFAGTNTRVNLISTLGYGDPATIFPRSPRPAFERFNRIA